MWDTKRILLELADAPRRRAILSTFWKTAEGPAKTLTTAQLAKALHFREETIRKMPLEKKADLLAGRAGAREFEQAFETALIAYHTNAQAPMLSAFLDAWQIPHVDGSIEVDDYKAPSEAEVRTAVGSLTDYDKRDVAIYLATAGLMMGPEWRDACWPVVDELVKELAS